MNSDPNFIARLNGRDVYLTDLLGTEWFAALPLILKDVVQHVTAGWQASCTTPIALGPGIVAVTLTEQRPFTPGMPVLFTDTENPDLWARGQLATYAPETGAATVTITAVNGAGTHASWHVSMDWAVVLAAQAAAVAAAGAAADAAEQAQQSAASIAGGPVASITTPAGGTKTGPVSLTLADLGAAAAGHTHTAAAIGALPAAGGQLTGAVTRTQTTTPAAINVGASNRQKITLAANTTFSFTGLPAAGIAWELELETGSAGAYTLTWPTINWAKGDGTYTSNFADLGITLSAGGTNFFLFWGVGTGSIYGRAL